MKKLLSIFSALALTLPLLAGVVTFKPGDFANQGTSSSGSPVSTTKNGVTVACDKGYGASSALRCYKNSVLTITSESKMSTIEFAFETASGQTYDGGLDATITVEGDGLSWENTLASQARFTEIKVTINADVPEETVDTISVTEALARLKDGKTGECYIKGKVSQIISNNVETYGNISYWMHDSENANDSIQAYRMKAAGNKDYASSADIEFVVGDVILVYATGLANYHNNNTGVDIPETTGGYYVRTISGKPSEKLDWAYGTAIRFEDHWQLEIAKTDADEANVLILKFASDKENAIAGHHYLAQGSSASINGSNQAITNGFVQLAFKEVSTGGYNVYATQVSAITADKVYTIAADLEFMAVRDDYETEIDLDGDRPFVPTEGQEITCEEARSYALSLPAGTTGDITVTVHGFVTDLFSNGITFWMADQQGSEKVFQSYLSVLPDGVALANGAEVKVTGKVTNYNGTPEISKGNVEVISGGQEIVPVEVNVAEALAACQALAQNATSTDVYAITGFIINIARDYSEQYGNISFWMSDNASDEKGDFEAYNVKCDATLAAKLLPGAKVKVTDKLKHFHQDAKPAEGDQPEKPERTVYETNGGGTVELLQGAGVEDIMSDAAVVKFIQNGQLYIIRNNAIYNVQGQQVK